MAFSHPEPTDIWQQIEFSRFGIAIAESTWAFPAIETLHVIALVTVVGTIMVMDLRLLGLASNTVAVTRLGRDTLPWTWAAFVLAALTGTLMWISKASTYIANPYFLWKMGFLAAAGLNMLYFQFRTCRTVDEWDNSASIPTGAKVAALLSLILWVAVVFFGRAIGFTSGSHF